MPIFFTFSFNVFVYLNEDFHGDFPFEIQKRENPREDGMESKVPKTCQ